MRDLDEDLIEGWKWKFLEEEEEEKVEFFEWKTVK